ncbi:MAG: glycosyltransferase family 2 protein [Bacteroidales bacterium]
MKKIDNSPLVTIGIPVYNGGKYIVETLVSIQKQTYTNFECHIVNNASTDATEDLVSDFIKDDPRFTIHSYAEFMDIGTNWNRTVQYIKEETKYFQIVAADDLLYPDALESHIMLMEKYPGAGIASAYRLYGKSVKGYGLDYFEGNYRDGKEMLVKHLKNEISITGSVTQNFYKVEYLKKLSFYPEIYIDDDIHFDTRLAYEVLFISDLVFSFKILSLTRTHPESVTSTVTRKLYTPILGRENRLYRFREHFPELNKHYSIIRRRYAYFLIMNYLTLNIKNIKWHKKNLKRKITFSEFIAGVLWENIFTRSVSRINRRYISL